MIEPRMPRLPMTATITSTTIPVKMAFINHQGQIPARADNFKSFRGISIVRKYPGSLQEKVYLR
jgi:hypothetical protein